MPDDHARSFAGGASDTSLTPPVLVAMLIAAVLILLLPRKYAMVPLFFVLFLVPSGQQLFLGGVHFYVFRILILTALCKMLVARVTGGQPVLVGGFGSVDKTFFWYAICMATASMLLFRDSSAVISQVAFLLDFLGGYCVLRYFIQDEDDIFRAMKCFAWISLIVAATMTREFFTGQNVFGFIGGLSAPEVRDGRVRCIGPFAHELLAGAFGSTLLPAFLWLWKSDKAKLLAAAAIVASVTITWTSNSSTSLFSFAAGLLAICLWPIRRSMRAVRWAVGCTLLALEIVMKAPVWFLIARVDLTGGSSSYHRAMLIDAFVRHFSDWWWIGVRDPGAWGTDLWDAQNQFVNVGETGGLLALVLFVAMICYAFSKVGKARNVVEGDPQKEWFIWVLGAILFSCTVAFFGVNYFDQTKFEWFAFLAMIVAATVPILNASAVEQAQNVPVLGAPRLAYSSASAPLSGKNALKSKVAVPVKSAALR